MGLALETRFGFEDVVHVLKLVWNFGKALRM